MLIIDRLAEGVNRAAIRTDQTVTELQEGGFAAAAGPNDRGDDAVGDGEMEVADGRLLAVRLAHMLEVDLHACTGPEVNRRPLPRRRRRHARETSPRCAGPADRGARRSPDRRPRRATGRPAPCPPRRLRTAVPPCAGKYLRARRTARPRG